MPMNLKTITTFLVLMFASLLFANEVNSFVAVSADGDDTTYTLANIKRIDVNTTGTSASVTVVLNDGAEEGTYTKLLFVKDITSIEGIGENAAIKIKEARDSNEITSVEAFQQKTMLSKSVIEVLANNHVFDNISQTDQLSIFDL